MNGPEKPGPHFQQGLTVMTMTATAAIWQNRATTQAQAAYWFFVCQNADESPDLICCTVSATRYRVLESYAYPLINHAPSHPVIEPHAKEIEPYVVHVHHLLQPVAATTASKFSMHVVPQWNNLVIPQCHACVVPHIKSAASHLDPTWLLPEPNMGVISRRTSVSALPPRGRCKSKLSHTSFPRGTSPSMATDTPNLTLGLLGNESGMRFSAS